MSGSTLSTSGPGVDWKDTRYRREQFTLLGTPSPLRRPLPERVAPLLAPTLADVQGFLTRHFPVQRLRSVPGRCAAAAGGCNAVTGFRGSAAGLPILSQRLLIDGDEGMRQGFVVLSSAREFHWSYTYTGALGDSSSCTCWHSIVYDLYLFVLDLCISW